MSEAVWTAQFEALLRDNLPFLEGDLAADASLADLGLDSLQVVNLVVALETSLDLILPDEVLTPETFTTPGALWSVVRDLQAAAATIGSSR